MCSVLLTHTRTSLRPSLPKLLQTRIRYSQLKTEAVLIPGFPDSKLDVPTLFVILHIIPSYIVGVCRGSCGILWGRFSGNPHLKGHLVARHTNLLLNHNHTPGCIVILNSHLNLAVLRAWLRLRLRVNAVSGGFQGQPVVQYETTFPTIFFYCAFIRMVLCSFLQARFLNHNQQVQLKGGVKLRSYMSYV